MAAYEPPPVVCRNQHKRPCPQSRQRVRCKRLPQSFCILNALLVVIVLGTQELNRLRQGRGAPHSRLQTPWEDFPVRRPGIKDQPGDGATQAPPSFAGISPVPRSERDASARWTPGAYHCGQLRNPQSHTGNTQLFDCPAAGGIGVVDTTYSELLHRGAPFYNALKLRFFADSIASALTAFSIG